MNTEYVFYDFGKCMPLDGHIKTEMSLKKIQYAAFPMLPQHFLIDVTIKFVFLHQFLMRIPFLFVLGLHSEAEKAAVVMETESSVNVAAAPHEVQP